LEPGEVDHLASIVAVILSQMSMTIDMQQDDRLNKNE
jgi:hypothetical protein